MKWADVVRMGLELPSVEESRWYGTPALKVGGKGFVRLKEDGETIVLGVETVDAQQFLISALPDVYFITPHYEGYPAVLVRLKALRVKEARLRLRQAWRLAVPPKVLKTLGALNSIVSTR